MLDLDAAPPPLSTSLPPHHRAAVRNSSAYGALGREVVDSLASWNARYVDGRPDGALVRSDASNALLALALLVPMYVAGAPTLEELRRPAGVQLGAFVCAAVARFANKQVAAGRFQQTTTWYMVPAAVFRLHPGDEAKLLCALRSPSKPPGPSLASELLDSAVLECCASPLAQFYVDFQLATGIRRDPLAPTSLPIA